MAKTPVFYRLEQVEDAATSVGYVRLKEFNALARKDIVTGTCSFDRTNFILCKVLQSLLFSFCSNPATSEYGCLILYS